MQRINSIEESKSENHKPQKIYFKNLTKISYQSIENLLNKIK